ncbi:MAG: GNAT family N-acetyltransferase [Bryobacteraceae bacterium]
MTIRMLTAGSGGTDYSELRAQLWPGPADVHQLEIEEQLADADWRVFLAEDAEGVITGFLELRLREYAEGAANSPVPFVEGWFVVPDHRRSGLGRALMEAAQSWAKSAGYSEIGSDTEASNTDSIQAHEHLGFQVVDRIVCLLKPLT